jgi:hypothetical protein
VNAKWRNGGRGAPRRTHERYRQEVRRLRLRLAVVEVVARQRPVRGSVLTLSVAAATP